MFNKMKVKFATWYGKDNLHNSFCSEECTQWIP